MNHLIQNQSPKLVNQRIRKHNYKTFGTSLINSKMPHPSLLFLAIKASYKSEGGGSNVFHTLVEGIVWKSLNKQTEIIFSLEI